jgi:hypothetical protein
MTLAADLLSVLEDARGIAGELGLRPVRVYVVTRNWSGTMPGEGACSDSETEILVARQSPKVRTLSGEAIAVNQLPEGTISIGPITPSHTTGGTSLALATGMLDTAQERWLKLTGGIHGTEGQLYRIIDVSADSAFHYTVRAYPLGREVRPDAT